MSVLWFSLAFLVGFVVSWKSQEFLIRKVFSGDSMRESTLKKISVDSLIALRDSAQEELARRQKLLLEQPLMFNAGTISKEAANAFQREFQKAALIQRRGR